MAITQYPINGDLAALKAALDATGFFSSTAYDNETTPTKVLCYDADDNLLFEVSAIGYKVYKSDGATVSGGGSSNYGSPVSLYSVGSKAALIHYANAKAQPSACAAFGLTNTGKIGFAIPASFGATSTNANITQMAVAAWDDPGDMTTLLQVAGSTPMVGNSVQFVPIPMHGVYGTPEFLENVYYMPMVQSGMRGLVQEIAASDGKVYFTNGYIAAYDDVGLTT